MVMAMGEVVGLPVTEDALWRRMAQKRTSTAVIGDFIALPVGDDGYVVFPVAAIDDTGGVMGVTTSGGKVKSAALLKERIEQILIKGHLVAEQADRAAFCWQRVFGGVVALHAHMLPFKRQAAPDG
jgi:hypothetical protein